MKYFAEVTYDIVSPTGTKPNQVERRVGFDNDRAAAKWADRFGRCNSYYQNIKISVGMADPTEIVPDLDAEGHIVRSFSRYMMATDAFHIMGNISSPDYDICHVYAEDSKNYYGSWIFGMGFFDVRFPKETTRDLTPDEIAEYQKKRMSMNGLDLGPVIK